jgi:hypothetical protein
MVTSVFNVITAIIHCIVARRPVDRQRPANSNRGTVLSVRSVPRCNHDNCSNELVVGQSPAGKNVSTEVENIIGIRYQTTTGEDTVD